MELVTATDTVHVKHPEGAKDKSGNGSPACRSTTDSRWWQDPEAVRIGTREAGRKESQGSFRSRHREGKPLKSGHKACRGIRVGASQTG